MRKISVKFALWVVPIGIVVYFAWYLWGAGATPSGQPPMASLSPQNLQQLSSDFNRASGDARLVLLLSPT